MEESNTYKEIKTSHDSWKDDLGRAHFKTTKEVIVYPGKGQVKQVKITMPKMHCMPGMPMIPPMGFDPKALQEAMPQAKELFDLAGKVLKGEVDSEEEVFQQIGEILKTNQKEVTEKCVKKKKPQKLQKKKQLKKQKKTQNKKS